MTSLESACRLLRQWKTSREAKKITKLDRQVDRVLRKCKGSPKRKSKKKSKKSRKRRSVRVQDVWDISPRKQQVVPLPALVRPKHVPVPAPQRPAVQIVPARPRPVPVPAPTKPRPARIQIPASAEPSRTDLIPVSPTLLRYPGVRIQRENQKLIEAPRQKSRSLVAINRRLLDPSISDYVGEHVPGGPSHSVVPRSSRSPQPGILASIASGVNNLAGIAANAVGPVLSSAAGAGLSAVKTHGPSVAAVANKAVSGAAGVGLIAGKKAVGLAQDAAPHIGNAAISALDYYVNAPMKPFQALTSGNNGALSLPDMGDFGPSDHRLQIRQDEDEEDKKQVVPAASIRRRIAPGIEKQVAIYNSLDQQSLVPSRGPRPSNPSRQARPQLLLESGEEKAAERPGLLDSIREVATSLVEAINPFEITDAYADSAVFAEWVKASGALFWGRGGTDRVHFEQLYKGRAPSSLRQDTEFRQEKKRWLESLVPMFVSYMNANLEIILDDLLMTTTGLNSSGRVLARRQEIIAAVKNAPVERRVEVLCQEVKNNELEARERIAVSVFNIYNILPVLSVETSVWIHMIERRLLATSAKSSYAIRLLKMLEPYAINKTENKPFRAGLLEYLTMLESSTRASVDLVEESRHREQIVRALP